MCCARLSFGQDITLAIVCPALEFQALVRDEQSKQEGFMDASSAYQDTLPLSSDALLTRMDGWGLTYRLHTHVPLRTVEDAKAVEDQFMVPGENALRVKNLYLRDKKKRNYLVSLEQSREIDLKALGAELGIGNLSFGSADRLFQNLGIRPRRGQPAGDDQRSSE